VGGNAETVCRRQITESILSRWSQPPDQPLPETAADLARYGQPACDLARGSAIIAAQAAYQLAKSDADTAADAHAAAARISSSSTAV
jgi:hypothetical protein